MIIIFTVLCMLSLFYFRKSIFQKLYDLYIEECEKEPEVKVSIIFLYYYGFWNIVEEGKFERIRFEAGNGLYFC